jgi:RNA polymerase sigma-70 factor (ECF subfamily)
MHTTSVSLLDRLRQQAEGPSWQEFVDLYEPWLRGQLRRHGLQAADADDVVQEILIVLMKQVANFRHNGRKGAFRAWLRGVTVNRLRELGRQQKYAPLAGGSELALRLEQLADDHSQLSQRWDREHDQHVVNQLLNRISGDFEATTWQAFRAFVLEGRTAAEVSAALGISQGAVWTAKSHVLKRLRQVSGDLLD